MCLCLEAICPDYACVRENLWEKKMTKPPRGEHFSFIFAQLLSAWGFIFFYILFLQSLVWNTADSVYLGREEAKKPVALYALVKPFPLNRMGKLLVSSCICKVIIVKLVQQFAAANAEEKKTTVCNNSWLFSNSFFISPSQTLLLQLRGGDDLSP